MLALRFANGIFEPIWNRQFIDHVQITVARVDRDRGPRGVLRAGRRDPRRLPEPPAPARRADRDGAADRLHGRLGPEREGEGAALAAHAGAEVGRARPVRARLHRGRGGARLPRGAGRRAATRRPRRYVAAKLYVDNWRWADTPVLRPRRQAAAAARDDDRDPVPARAASALRRDRGRRAAAERAPDPRPAGRGRLARDRREGSGRGDDASAPCTWTSSTAAPSARACPRRTSA